MNLAANCVFVLTLFCAAMDFVPVLSDDGGSLNRTVPTYDDFFPQVLSREDQCLRVKGQDFVNKFKVAEDNAIACIAPTVASIISPSRNWVNELTDLTEKEKLLMAIETGCHAISEVKRCFWDLSNLWILCLTHQEKENVKGIRNAVFEAANYLCYSKGARYIEILKAKVQECAKSREEGLDLCWKDFATLEKDPESEIIPFNTKTCRVIKDGAFCVVTELSKCVDRKSAEIMRGLVKIVLKELACK